MGSTWEPAHKRISRLDSASLQYSLYEGVGRSAWTQKGVVRPVYLIQGPRPDASLTLCLLQPWRGTLCTVSSSLMAPKARSSIGISPLRQQAHLQNTQKRRIVRRCNFTRIVHRALSTRTANLPSCDALPGAWLKRLGADVPPARPRARIRVK